MILILSGEGGTDLGGESEFGARPGPMAHLVDQLIEDLINYSPIQCQSVKWYSRSQLGAHARATGVPRMALPGSKRAQGYVGHFKQAQALGILARETEQREVAPSLAIMFRDSDGTNSSPTGHWENLVNAIDSGFKAADYLYGVAMVPKPKQESWLLCALKDDPYVGCQPLEDESGNDDAPRALKTMLRDAVGFEPSVDDMCEWITTRRFDSSRVQMASFERFKESLTQAIRALQAR